MRRLNECDTPKGCMEISRWLRTLRSLTLARTPLRGALAVFSVLLLLAPIMTAQVSNERLLRAADEPQNWMTYSGTYASQRYSTLRQITPGNVKTLEQKWIFPAESLEKFETTPLVVDGIMYITQAPSDALAL